MLQLNDFFFFFSFICFIETEVAQEMLGLVGFLSMPFLLLFSSTNQQLSDSLPVQPMVKPMTLKERCYARKHRTFLVRNVDKIRNQSKPGKTLFPESKEEANPLDSNKINVFNPGKTHHLLSQYLLRQIQAILNSYKMDIKDEAMREKKSDC